MFKHLYIGELKKMFSLKTAIVFLVIFIVGFLIVGFSFNTLRGLVNNPNMLIDGEPGMSQAMPSNKINVSEGQARSALAYAQSELTTLQKTKSELGYKYYMSFLSSSDSVYSAKSLVTLYNYIIDNELYDQDIYYYDTSFLSLDAIAGQSATGFAYTMLGVFAFLLTIYALIIGSGAYSTEMRNGTLKILLLNPITRNQLTFAKLLSMLTLLAGAVMTVFLCTTAYSYIAYGDPSYKLLYVFNASSVIRAGYSFPLFLGVLSLFISTIFYGLTAFFFGTVTKRRVLGFVLPLAIDMAAPLVGLAGLGRFWLSNIINLTSFFGINSGLYTGSNFFISLPLFAAIFAAMTAVSFIVVDKRDIA